MSNTVRVARRLVHSQTVLIVAVILLFGLCLINLAISQETSKKQIEDRAAVAEARANDRAREAEARAALAEEQAERNRLTFCGIFEALAIQPKNPNAPTQLGNTLIERFQIAVASPDRLGCTPDRTDQH